MFFVALAVDYDGTVARDGRVDAATVAALEKVKKSGRKLILVTGRDLDDLRRVFPEMGIFDLVVAENGERITQPTRPESAYLSANGRGCRRPDMDASFAFGGLFALVRRSHQGRGVGGGNQCRRAKRNVIRAGNARRYQRDRGAQIYGSSQERVILPGADNLMAMSAHHCKTMWSPTNTHIAVTEIQPFAPHGKRIEKAGTGVRLQLGACKPLGRELLPRIRYVFSAKAPQAPAFAWASVQGETPVGNCGTRRVIFFTRKRR